MAQLLESQQQLWWTTRMAVLQHGPMHPVETLEVALVACVTVALIYGLTALFGRCAPIPPTWKDKGETIRFGCETGEYNDLGTLFLAQPDGTVRKLLSLGASDRDTMDENRMHPLNMMIFVMSYFVMVSLACGTAIPGGLFLPSVMLGSSLGVLTAMVYKMILPQWYLAYNPIQPGLFALIGATAMLAGVFRSTISVVVIMVEGTDGLIFLFPIIVSVIIGNWASHHLIDASVYEADLEREAHVAFLAPEPPSELVYLTAGDMMCRNPIVLAQSDTFGNIVRALTGSRHNGFPVVERRRDGAALLRGVILRSQLLVMLGCRAAEINGGASPSPGPSPASSPVRNGGAGADEAAALLSKSKQKSMDIQMRLYHQIKHPYRRHLSSHAAELHSLGISSLMGGDPLVPQPGPMVEVAGAMGALGEDAEEDAIDLRPYMNLGPLTVSVECPATRVHTLFRALQLRHLCVLDADASVVGIITRKDLHAAVSIAAPFSTKRQALKTAISPMRGAEYEQLDGAAAEGGAREGGDDWHEKDAIHITSDDQFDLPNLP